MTSFKLKYSEFIHLDVLRKRHLLLAIRVIAKECKNLNQRV